MDVTGEEKLSTLTRKPCWLWHAAIIDAPKAPACQVSCCQREHTEQPSITRIQVATSQVANPQFMHRVDILEMMAAISHVKPATDVTCADCLCLVLLPVFGNIFRKRIIRIWSAQQGLYAAWHSELADSASPFSQQQGTQKVS